MAAESARTLTVVERRVEADDVVALVLADTGGHALPAWEAGAHVDLVLAPGLVRQYSLCSDPARPDVWRVAVLRETTGRGGSVHVHERLREGSAVEVRGPRNHFPLRPAPAYLFVAGGIGITPVLPMLRAATAAGVPWRLAYGGRSTSSMAFVAEVSARADEARASGLAAAVDLWPLDERGLLPVADLVGWAGEHVADVYCCGPEGLIEAVEKEGLQLGAGRVHVERFRAPEDPAAALAAHGSDGGPGDRDRTDAAFELVVQPSGVTLTVPAGRSALEVMEDAGCAPLSSCREGTCGTCEVSVLDGDVDHRDWLLTEDEKAANDTMFVCVSRARGPRLVIEL